MLPEELELRPEERGLITRRACTLHAAVLFAATFLFVITIQSFVFIVFDLSHDMYLARNAGDVLLTALTAFYFGAPPLAAIGALIGFELFRLASGSRQPKASKWYIWVLGFILIGYWLLFIYFQYRRRNEVILKQRAPGWIGPVLYGMGVLVICLLFAQKPGGSGSFYVGSFFNGILALLIADCLAVNIVGRWMQSGRLAPPSSHTFQFSLGTLFFSMLALGAYLSGAVLLLR